MNELPDQVVGYRLIDREVERATGELVLLETLAEIDKLVPLVPRVAVFHRGDQVLFQRLKSGRWKTIATRGAVPASFPVRERGH